MIITGNLSQESFPHIKTEQRGDGMQETGGEYKKKTDTTPL